MQEDAQIKQNVAPPRPAGVPEGAVINAAMSPPAAPDVSTKALPPIKPITPQPADNSTAAAIGDWIHRHKSVTNTNPLGYTGYQFARSAIASVPYGVSMAATWLAFHKLGKYGYALEKAGKNVGSSFQAGVGNTLAKFCNSDAVRTSFMIGTSFTLYRGTSKIGKWVNEHLFNESDSRETTIEKVKQLPSELGKKITEVGLAEVHSTMISAFALGFIVKSFKAPPELGKALADNKAMRGVVNRVSHFFNEVIGNKDTQFVQQAAINTVGYSLFFELGDRRYKDKQISRGLWGGNLHALGSDSRSNPSLNPVSYASLDEPKPPVSADETKKSIADSSGMNDRLSVLTSEPSALRFVFRRVVPTCIGITAYTALKMRGAPLVLGDMVEPLKTKGLAGVPLSAWREGAATSLFFMIPFVTDIYAPAYDKVVNRLEGWVSGKKQGEALPEEVPLAPQEKARIAANFSTLGTQLDAKYQGAVVGRG